MLRESPVRLMTFGSLIIWCVIVKSPYSVNKLNETHLIRAIWAIEGTGRGHSERFRALKIEVFYGCGVQDEERRSGDAMRQSV